MSILRFELLFHLNLVVSYLQMKEMNSGTMSLDENGLKGGMSSDEKEMKRASGSMSSEWAKGWLVSHLQMTKR